MSDHVYEVGDYIIECDKRCRVPNDCRKILELPEDSYGNGFVRTVGYMSGRESQIRMDSVATRYRHVAEFEIKFHANQEPSPSE